MKNFKSGVSLVTVLLFMLVATIAATATYKWLTSEGRSSASRMMEAEAKQAAVAGIESARSWMTYHGNEVGAIVKQYFSPENDKKPINLDRVLSSGLNGHQDYSVYVVGVDASTNVYKIKVISQGTSRNGTKHTEAAIMKVSGLYRVLIPTEQPETTPVPYEFGYVGGGTGIKNNSNEGSGTAPMLVYGDLSGLELSSKGDLIVTGSLGDAGTNRLTVDGKVCVGENLNITKQGFRRVTDVYVRGNATFNFDDNGSAQNVYFGGNVTAGTLGFPIKINGDVTLNGTWTHPNVYPVNIKGNMCLGNTAGIDFGKPYSGRKFTVEGSMWVPNANALHNTEKSVGSGRINADSYKNVILGNKASSELYIQNINLAKKYRYSEGYLHSLPTSQYWANYSGSWDSYTTDNGKAARDCKDESGTKCYGDNAYTYYFQAHTLNNYSVYTGGSCNPNASLANCEERTGAFYTNSFDAFTSKAPEANIHSSVSGDPKITCGASSGASSIKTFCEEYFNKKIKKCDGHDALDDILVTGKGSFEDKANNTECVQKLLKKTTGYHQGGWISTLNSCYSGASVSEKYSGEYLVVKAKAAWMTKLFLSAEATIVGKYIFIVDEPEEGPEGGSNKLGAIPFGPDNPYGELSYGVKLPPTGTDSYVFLYLPNGAGVIDQAAKGDYKYFIYSMHDIAGVGARVSSDWLGSFYMSSKHCAKIVAFASGDAITIDLDKKFISHLMTKHVVCEKTKASTCTEVSGDGESTETSSSTIAEGGYDVYHIATGPQLHIEVESEYSNSESVGRSNDVEKSILVLPRVVYVNANSSGKLTDYITVLPLNGASIAKNGNKVAMSGITSCKNGGPSASISLSSQASVLQTGKHYECSYSENSFESTFHILVTEGSVSMPSVYLEPPALVPITTSSQTSNTVNLIVPAFDGDAQNFSVEIHKIDNNLDGWTVLSTSNVDEKPGSNGTVYTYSGTTSSTLQTIPVFTVSTEANSHAGSVIFALQSPTNCSLTSNTTKTYSITGSASVERRSIKEYCSKYPENCEGDGLTYKNAEDEEDCDYDGIWVDANPNCMTEEGGANNKWKCASGNSSNNPIHLESHYTGTQCVLYIPSDDNYIIGAKDDSENSSKPYILYASLKKKKFPLKIIKEANVSSGLDIDVYTKKEVGDGYELYETCKAKECDYSFVVGTRVKLEPKPSSDNTFNYWSCNSSQCEWVNNLAKDIEFTMDRERSYTAHFNERDEHCFYSALDTITVSCDRVSNPETNRHCIDECSASETSCHVGSGIYGDNAKWLRVYSDNPYLPSTESGFMRNPRGNKVSFIMHRNVAGPNGMLTARIKTAKIASGHENDMLNDGLVVRANKSLSEYLMVNIYGVSNDAFARVCLASGLSTSSDKCIKKRLENSSGSSFTVDPYEAMNVKLTLDRSNLTVELKKGSGTYSKVFDLVSDWNNGTLNDGNHQYVGFKLSNPEFQIHDIGWRTTDFTNAGCFDYPSISCSFAAQYVGGQIPLEKDVEPWIGYSSWFEYPENCRRTDYFYNDCDMASGYLTGTCSNSGTKLKLSGDKFKFTEEGEHGYRSSDGVGLVKNGSVAAACTQTENTSIELSANCGWFYVGELNECSKNEDILTSSTSMGTVETAIQKDGALFNLRGAELNFTFTDLADGGDIKVVLVDDADIHSPARYISSIHSSIDVDEFLNQQGFNPEKVKKILMTGSSSYTLKAISSSCPNAVSISCISADFKTTGDDKGKWVINTSYRNSENAKKCKVSADPSNIPMPENFVSCNTSSGKFVVEDKNGVFEDLLHSGNSELSYKFTIDVYDDDDASLTDKPAASCSKETTEKYKKVGVTCSIEKKEGESEISVIQGLGVPKLNYSFVRCPSYGCYYSLTLTDDIKIIGYGADATAVLDGDYHWQDKDANKDTRLGVGSYSYTVAVTDHEGKVYASCTTKEQFKVLKAVEATASCSISGSTLTVSVDGANYTAVPVTIALSYKLGNLISTQTVSVKADDDYKTDVDLNELIDEGQTVVAAVTLGTSPVTCSPSEYTRPVGAPTGTCSVSPESMYSDDVNKATFSVSNVTHCDSWVLKKEGVTDPVSSGSTATSISVDNLGPGKYSLYFNESATAHCTETIREKTHATLSCSGIAIEDKDEASSVDITINHDWYEGTCDGKCTYTVATTTTGASVSDATGDFTGGDITFKATNPSGPSIDYSLTLTDDGGHTTDACEFSVTYNHASSVECECGAFVNGTGDFHEQCYNSGLQNMAGKCYSMNPDRISESPVYINEDASQTWWWIEVSCTEWTGCSGGGSGGGGDDGFNWTNNTTLEAGTHTIAKCNGYTGTKTTQIKASFANSWNAFSATTGADYWNNVTGNCNGYASVTYPVTVTVPSGGTLTLSNCY